MISRIATEHIFLIIIQSLYSIRLLQDHNVISQADGVHSNVIKIKPPMTFNKEDCSCFLKALDLVLTKLSSSQ